MNLNIPCRSIPMPYYVDNSGPDYENMPITFAPLSQAGSIRMMLVGPTTTLPNTYNFYYKKNTDSEWKPYLPTSIRSGSPPASSVISLNVGQYVSFSGTQDFFNTGWEGVKNTFSSSVQFKCYGRLDSLTNGATPVINNGSYGPYAWTFLNQDNGSYYNNNIVNFRNLILPYPSGTYCFIGFFEDNGSISSTPVFRYSTNQYNYHQIFKHNGGTFPYGGNKPSNLVMQFAFDTWYSNDWQNNAWASVPTSPVFIVPSGCNYVNTLKSASSRPNAIIVYRNANGLFYNDQQINEQILLDTGAISYV